MASKAASQVTGVYQHVVGRFLILPSLANYVHMASNMTTGTIPILLAGYEEAQGIILLAVRWC